MQFFCVEVNSQCLLLMGTTLANGASDGVNDCRTTLIMAELVIAHSVDCHQIALVFNGSGPRQQMPGCLSCLWPVGNNQNGIILHPFPIAVPARETQIIAGEQQESHSTVRYDGVAIA